MIIISNGRFNVGATDYTFEILTANDGWVKIVTRSCYKAGDLSIVYVRVEEFLTFLLGKHRAN